MFFNLNRLEATLPAESSVDCVYFSPGSSFFILQHPTSLPKFL